MEEKITRTKGRGKLHLFALWVLWDGLGSPPHFLYSRKAAMGIPRRPAACLM